jgi:hypothetical protein
MSIMVTQAFVDAVLAWEEAALAAGGSAPGLWAKVLFEGTYCRFAVGGTMAAADAVLNGEAIVFAGGGMAWGIGGGEAGFASLAGIGAGLAVSAAVLIVAGGALYVHAKNKRDLNRTKADAFHLYIYHYWPKYVKFALKRMQETGGRVPPEPLTFNEFFEHRGERITVPH